MAKHKTHFEDCDVLVVGGGKLSLDPSASARFFCIAAPGL